MATSVKYPQSNTAGWTNSNNAHADDGSYSTAAPAKNSTVSGKWYNFDFQIPTGSTINSITLETQYKVDTNASNFTFHMQAYKGATAMGTDYTDTSEPTGDTTRTHNNVGSWTVSELNTNTTSGLQVNLGAQRGSSNTAVTASVDYIKVTVDYTPPPVQGGSTVGIIITPESDGTKQTTGSSSVGIEQDTTQAGIKQAIGSSSTGIEQNTEQAGIKQAIGSSEADIIITAEGGGQVAVQSESGGSESSITISADGSGIKKARSPPSEPSIIVEADGTGYSGRMAGSSSEVNISTEQGGISLKSGNSESEIVISADSSGTPSKNSGSTTEIQLSTEQSGYSGRYGSKETEINVTLESSGKGTRKGSGETSILLESDGAGNKSISNGSSAEIVITAEGEGTANTDINGGSTAVIILTPSGNGKVIKQGSSESTVSIYATGSGTKKVSGGSSAGILIAVSSSGKDSTVYVPSLSITEYNIIGTISELEVIVTATEYFCVMGVEGVAYAGSTVTLSAVFPAAAGDLDSITSVSVDIMYPGEHLVETITDVTKDASGSYHIEYTVPLTYVGSIQYKFKGTLGTKYMVGQSSFDVILPS